MMLYAIHFDGHLFLSKLIHLFVFVLGHVFCLYSNNKIINPNRVTEKGKSHLRSNDTIRRLAMYKAKAVHNRDGEFITGPYMNRGVDNPVSRIAPDRRWFGNTRVIDQQQLQQFRQNINNKINDSYTVVLRSNKLPMSLIKEVNNNKTYYHLFV